MKGPSRKTVLLDLKLYYKEGLVADVRAVATSITVTLRSWNSVLLEETALGFRRVNFSLLRTFFEEFHVNMLYREKRS